MPGLRRHVATSHADHAGPDTPAPGVDASLLEARRRPRGGPDPVSRRGIRHLPPDPHPPVRIRASPMPA
jgi:hypothetical protein